MKRSRIFLLTVCLVLSGCAIQQSAYTNDRLAPEKWMMIYTPLEEKIWGPIMREFQERSGVWVQVEQGSASDLLESFRKSPEKCDLLFGFDMESLQECENLLQDLSTADLSGASEKGVCVFRELPVIVYNPRLMQKNLPTGFRDLLDVRWQGSISMENPSESSFGEAVLSVLSQLDVDESVEDTLRRFGENLPSLADCTQEVLDDVNDGTYLLGVVPESGALEAISLGASLALIYPEEGSYLLAVGAGVSEQAEHTDEAEAFVDFLMEEDTQHHIWEFLHLRPALDSGKFLPENVCIPQQQNDAHHRRLMELWTQLREERS